MNEKHLTYFKVENFKRFESFEMDNIGQFNLILGDNNVGKTSVLEALLFDDSDFYQTNMNFITVLYKFRNIEETDYPLELFVKADKRETERMSFIIRKENSDSKNPNNQDITSEEKKIRQNPDLQYIKYNAFIGTRYRIEGNSNPVYHPDSHTLEIRASLGETKLYSSLKSIPYIPFHIGYDKDLTNYYTNYIQKTPSLKKAFIQSLKSLIPNVTSIDVSIDKQPLLIIEEEGKNYTMPLSMFGDGSIKLFKILAKIIVHRGKRLMIDEIEAGIHFKKLKDFWHTILFVAKNNDVQLFVTTHSGECLQAFKDVLEKDEFKNITSEARTITLFQTKDNHVKARTRNFEAFQEAIDEGYNIRGGE